MLKSVEAWRERRHIRRVLLAARDYMAEHGKAEGDYERNGAVCMVGAVCKVLGTGEISTVEGGPIIAALKDSLGDGAVYSIVNWSDDHSLPEALYAFERAARLV